jgi:lysyl-tRNA synthetase class 2
MAYADVHDLMEMTEELVSGLVYHIHGSYETVYHTAKGEEYKVNWKAPWKRIDMMPSLEEVVGEKFPPSDELHTAETGEFLKKALAKLNLECTPPLTNARMLDTLVGEYLEEQCVSTLK